MLKQADPNRVNAFVQVNNQFYIRMFRVKKIISQPWSLRNPSPKTLIDFNIFGHQMSACQLVLLVKRLILVTFRKSCLGNDLFILCHPEKFKIGIIFQFFWESIPIWRSREEKGPEVSEKNSWQTHTRLGKRIPRNYPFFLILELLIFMY